MNIFAKDKYKDSVDFIKENKGKTAITAAMFTGLIIRNFMLKKLLIRALVAEENAVKIAKQFSQENQTYKQKYYESEKTC